MFESIVTPRLILRRLVPADADAMFAYRTDPEVSRYQTWEPASTGEIRAFIAGLGGLEPITPGTWFQIGITMRDTGELAGDCGLHARAEEPRQVELGITLAPAFQRRGLASEAFDAMLGFLFTQTETHRVFCSVDPRNRPCLRLLARIGLRQEAHLVEAIFLRGAWVDDVVFAILRKEWMEATGSNPPPAARL